MAQAAGIAHRASVRDRASALVALTKPRIIALLLVTTPPSMYLAAEGWPEPALVVATLIGGALTAGAANAFNMILDRDIDVLMERTRNRPLPTGQVSETAALAFATTLAVAGPLWLWATVNLLAAIIATAGMAFYVSIYTAILKRRTVQNIVIGGAAGAVPALVGWAAVANELHAAAWLLFGVIFLWTPPHFWALAVMRTEDYAAAGVPMMPVVKGAAATARSGFRYAVLTVVASLAVPFVHTRVGWLYVAAASALGALFIGRAAQFRRDPSKDTAGQLFAYSIVYLGALSLAVVLDQVTPPF